MPVLDERFFLELIVLVALPIAVGVLAARWLGAVARHRGSTPGMVRLIRIGITILWASIAASGVSVTLGPINILSTLTASAIAGLVITLALQTTLQNFVAGFTLLRNSFLRVGDRVSISGTKGSVVNIGLIDTVLRMEDGTLVFVSNSTLMAGPLLNYTASERLKEEY